jgi:hypothetical protein
MFEHLFEQTEHYNPAPTGRQDVGTDRRPDPETTRVAAADRAR